MWRFNTKNMWLCPSSGSQIAKFAEALDSTVEAASIATAAEIGITVADSILFGAVMMIEGGELNVQSKPASLPSMTVEALKVEDAAFLAELECAPERIPALQAALAAADR